MYGLIKKDWDKFGADLAVVIILSLYWLFTAPTLGTNIVIIMGMVLFLSNITAVLVVEQAEEKYNGYAFLKTLPLHKSEVTYVKYALPLLNTAVAGAAFYATITVLGGPPELVSFGRMYVAFCGVCSLILTGILYTAIIIFGFANVMRFGIFTGSALALVLGSIISMLMARSIIPSWNVLISSLVDFLTGLDIRLLIICGLVVYLALMLTSLRLRDVRK